MLSIDDKKNRADSRTDITFLQVEEHWLNGC